MTERLIATAYAHVVAAVASQRRIGRRLLPFWTIPRRESGGMSLLQSVRPYESPSLGHSVR